MAFTLSRIDRKSRTYDLSATVLAEAAAIPPDLTGVDVALLPPRGAPTAATVWYSAAYDDGSFTVLLAGPDADSTGALVVTGSADIWMRIADTPEVDAEKLERITVLGGGSVTPLPTLHVSSVNGMTGTVVLEAADVGAVATPTGGSDGQALVKSGAGAVWGTVAGGTTSPAETALAKFYGSAATRDAAPVIVALWGDSYTAGTDPNMWGGRFSVWLQSVFAKRDGTSSPTLSTDLATARASRSVGVQVVNSAISGKTTSNFLDATTRAQVAALQPAMIVCMLGANDVGVPTTAATYKANLQTEIDYQKVSNPTPCVFVLIHAFRRASASQASWDAYGAALREIAAADPDNVVTIDLEPAFEAVSVPGDDPLDLLAGDNLHPTYSGATFIADLVAAALRPRLNLGVVTGPAADAPPPVLTNTVAPAITGTATTGQTLTVSNGTWSATPDSYTYQWKRAGAAISGATSSTYVLQVADEALAITCTVTAIKLGYVTGSATSNSVTPSAAGSPALTNTVLPAITGTATEGQTLSVSNGTWSATPDSYTYQWKRAGSAVSGATASTYLLVTADVGNTMTCTVTAVKSGYTSGSATSAATATVSAAGGTAATLTWAFTGGSKAATSDNANITGGTITVGAGVLSFNTATGGYASDPVFAPTPVGSMTSAALAVTGNAYVALPITIGVGKTFTPTGLTMNGARGGSSSPRGFKVATPVDNVTLLTGAGDMPTVRPNWTAVTIDVTGVGALSGSKEFRIFIYAPAGGAAVDMDDIVLTGTIV